MDYASCKPSLTRNFFVDFTTKAECFVFQGHGTAFFTVGSKIVCGVAVFSDTHRVTKSDGLPGFDSEFQAKVRYWNPADGCGMIRASSIA